jgi:PPIC-type PPIASE domain
MGKGVRFASACCVGLSAAVFGACGGSSGTVLARVDGVPITMAAVEHWMAVEASTGAPTATARRERERRALGFLISSQWTLGEARALGVRVSGREVRQQATILRFERRSGARLGSIPREAELMRFLAGLHVAAEDQEWIVKLALLDARIERRRVAQAVTRVSHAEIVGYYRHNWRRFFVREHREVAIIETRTEPPIRRAKREIESGKNFVAVARRVSVDPRARRGTLVLIREEGAAELTRAIFAAKPHMLLGPYLIAWYYMFEVLRVMPAHELPLAQVRPAIVQALATRAASTSLREAYEQRWARRTICRPGLAAPGCGAHNLI